ncbi:MAG: hypothetical protein ACLP0B_09885 [Steroidobacteraceae bacterium]
MTLPAIVDEHEEVASFVFESNKFKGNDLDFRQLMPSKRFGNTSVYRTVGLSETETADAGHAIALERPKPGILGWGVLIARAIRLISPLSINAAEPPPRHALIEGWPAAVQEQRALAMNLASKATVIKRTTVPAT